MNQFTDKEILGDGLSAAKATTANFNMFSNECTHEKVRNTMLNILEDEHDIQDDVFHLMSSRGYYPTPAAENKKILEAKQRFECGVTR
ncbi:MAG: spore coat protein [Eubacterium sp.]|jgi:Coat F domain.|nr:spore coat protein [Eubacterium sp.]